MNIVTDMWLATSVPGYEEVKAFYARMGEKLGWSSSSGGMGSDDAIAAGNDEGDE